MNWFALLRRYRVYLLGAIGWAMIAVCYPIGWQLPTYAGY